MTPSLLLAVNPLLSQPVPAWVWIVLIAACAVATATDLRARRIPNWLTLPLLGGGLTYGLAIGGLDGLANSFIGAIAAGAIFVVAYAAVGGGAGDAKLMLALGSWLGLDASIALVLFVTSAGFVTAVGILIARHGLLNTPGIILLIMFRTVVGLVILRKEIFTGPSKASAPSPTDDEAVDDLDSRTSQSRRGGAKDWFPYAPSILAGTVFAWIFLDVFGGFG